MEGFSPLLLRVDPTIRQLRHYPVEHCCSGSAAVPARLATNTTYNATLSDCPRPRCTPKGQPGNQAEPYGQEGDQHLPLRSSRTRSGDDSGQTRQHALCLACPKTGTRQTCGSLPDLAAKPTGAPSHSRQADYESGRSTVSI